MKVVFISNYFNHHVKPLSDALARSCEYNFVATGHISAERIALGYPQLDAPEYVCCQNTDPARARRVLERADVVLAGSAPEWLVQRCIRQGKLVFRYHERPLKNGPQPCKAPVRWIKWHCLNPKSKPVYLLSVGDGSWRDYAKYGIFRGKSLCWGYFPELKSQDVNSLMRRKKAGSILWVGRFLPWKHPEKALEMARQLKAEGYAFSLTMIGTGQMERSLREMARLYAIADRVEFTGPMPPEQVRARMEESEIFLFTSDRREGWGAVLNEAMNSGCAVVADSNAGATAELVRSGQNGLVYRHDAQLYCAVRSLLEDRETAHQLGEKAYLRIKTLWNADVAAQRFLQAAQDILQGRAPGHYADGPCRITEGG